MGSATQEGRNFQFFSTLDLDALLFYRLRGTERVSGLFEFEYELLSEDNLISPDKVLGTNTTLIARLPDGSPRYFNGVISRFGQWGLLGQYSLYRATVRPWLWFLTRTRNCRIFQNLTVPQIISKILGERGFTHFEEKLSRGYSVREYCVQYRETDFSFISRLMEEEGYYYYFEHDKDHHKLVFADSVGAHKPVAGYETIPFFEPFNTEVRDRDHISDWGYSREVQPVRFVMTDYDFKKPATSLQVQSVVTRQHERAEYEVFDYPGEYLETKDGEGYAGSRLHEFQTNFQTLYGGGNARGLIPGGLFKLSQHPRDDQNREYLTCSVDYQLESNEYHAIAGGAEQPEYQCRFTAIASDQRYVPPRVTPRPIVQGPQTAVVVGPKDEEIWTDEYGRIKAQFHWDREGKMDENSSCWMRVSQAWAGKGWGAMVLPRIGQEVIVDFLEGDPDKPIITGRVYNAQQKPPYPLPAERTKSTFKTDSSKGSGGFNELRFEDKKGAEQIFIHAERNHDLRVKNDSMESVGHDRHRMVSHDEIIKIGGDQHETVTGDRNEQIDGAVSLKIGSDHQHKVGMKYGMEAGQEIHLKAGMNVVIEAGVSLTIKAGGSFINIGPAGVAINGAPMVLVNSGGAAGSGSGCSPEVPKKPKAADDAKAGQKAAPPPARPPKPTNAATSPAALVLSEAAKNGTPFCEMCQKAAAEAGAI